MAEGFISGLHDNFKAEEREQWLKANSKRVRQGEEVAYRARVDEELAKEGAEATLRTKIEGEMRAKYMADKAAIEAGYRKTLLDDPNFVGDYMLHMQKKQGGSG